MIGAGRPVDAITLFVSDPETSRSFYTRVFDTEPIHVDDVSAAFRLGDGAIVNGPLDRPWGIRTAAFADPDGHIWEIAHSLG